MRHIDGILDELTHTLKAVSEAEAMVFQGTVLAGERIFVAGKGRSGFQMRGFAMRLMQLGMAAHFTDDVVTPAIRARDVLVIGSGSGRTASLIQYAERAQEVGAKLALVTIDPASPLGNLADCVVQIRASTPKAEHAGGPQSIQPIGTLFEQALGIFLDATILSMMHTQGISAAMMFERHANLE